MLDGRLTLSCAGLELGSDSLEHYISQGSAGRPRLGGRLGGQDVDLESNQPCGRVEEATVAAQPPRHGSNADRHNRNACALGGFECGSAERVGEFILGPSPLREDQYAITGPEAGFDSLDEASDGAAIKARTFERPSRSQERSYPGTVEQCRFHGKDERVDRCEECTHVYEARMVGHEKTGTCRDAPANLPRIEMMDPRRAEQRMETSEGHMEDPLESPPPRGRISGRDEAPDQKARVADRRHHEVGQEDDCYPEDTKRSTHRSTPTCGLKRTREAGVRLDTPAQAPRLPL